jgi:hypothetical protein
MTLMFVAYLAHWEKRESNTRTAMAVEGVFACYQELMP